MFVDTFCSKKKCSSTSYEVRKTTLRPFSYPLSVRYEKELASKFVCLNLARPVPCIVGGDIVDSYPALEGVVVTDEPGSLVTGVQGHVPQAPLPLDVASFAVLMLQQLWETAHLFKNLSSKTHMGRYFPCCIIYFYTRVWLTWKMQCSHESVTLYMRVRDPFSAMTTNGSGCWVNSKARLQQEAVSATIAATVFILDEWSCDWFFGKSFSTHFISKHVFSLIRICARVWNTFLVML